MTVASGKEVDTVEGKTVGLSLYSTSHNPHPTQKNTKKENHIKSTKSDTMNMHQICMIRTSKRHSSRTRCDHLETVGSTS